MSAGFTRVSNVLLDCHLAGLSGGETKTYLYVNRRTTGFQKVSDGISVSQICNGIRKRDGTVLDRGTGLSRETVVAALVGLQQKGLVVRTLGTGTIPNSYTIIELEQSENPTASGRKIRPVTSRKIRPLTGRKTRLTIERGKSSSERKGKKERDAASVEGSIGGATSNPEPKPLESLKADDEKPKTAREREIFDYPEDELKAIYREKTGDELSPDVQRRIWELVEIRGVARKQFMDELRKHVPNTWKNPAGFLTNFARKIGSVSTPDPPPASAPEPPKDAKGRCSGCSSIGYVHWDEDLAAREYCDCQMGRELRRVDGRPLVEANAPPPATEAVA